VVTQGLLLSVQHLVLLLMQYPVFAAAFPHVACDRGSHTLDNVQTQCQYERHTEGKCIEASCQKLRGIADLQNFAAELCLAASNYELPFHTLGNIWIGEEQHYGTQSITLRGSSGKMAHLERFVRDIWGIRLSLAALYYYFSITLILLVNISVTFIASAYNLYWLLKMHHIPILIIRLGKVKWGVRQEGRYTPWWTRRKRCTHSEFQIRELRIR